jgi:hypothetical protein
MTSTIKIQRKYISYISKARRVIVAPLMNYFLHILIVDIVKFLCNI